MYNLIIKGQIWHFSMNKLNYLEYLKILGTRVKQYRVNLNISQKDLEEKTGISIRTISRFEQGSSIQLDAFIKILIALNVEENIELLIEDQTTRPSYFLNEKQISNQRVKRNKTNQTFTWGEDK